MTLQEYIDKINKRYITGISREHSYRGDLQTLLETMTPDVLVTNEPTRVECGAPDYIITRNFPENNIVDKRMCLSLDVFGLKVMNAVTLQTNIPKRVDDSCKEIISTYGSLLTRIRLCSKNCLSNIDGLLAK